MKYHWVHYRLDEMKEMAKCMENDYYRALWAYVSFHLRFIHCIGKYLG